MDKDSIRKQQLIQFAQTVEQAAVRGMFGTPLHLRQTHIINGPRAGVLEIDAGWDSGALLKALDANDSATLRQVVPWAFTGDPSVFMKSRYVRVEAGWPAELADDRIALSQLGQYPTAHGRWIVGRNEHGQTLTAALSDRSPHWLISGATGSGKTTALISAINQFSQDVQNRLVLVDCKHGASLRAVASLRGLVAPLAEDISSARAALTWCVQEMTARYSGRHDARRLIVIIDEVQDTISDPLTTEALRRLVTQGRGAQVHVIAATQHPVVAALGGPTIGRSLVGRLALRVSDFEASRVALGAPTPRADHLLGQGDAYAVVPGATHRVQCAYSDSEPTFAEPEMSEWPEVEAVLPETDNWPTGAQVGVAIQAAEHGEGRKRFVDALRTAGLPTMGNDRANRILKLGRETHTWLTSVRPSCSIDTPKIA